jgi:acetyl-CoA carboxylase biotin carboxyl carrier protein
MVNKIKSNNGQVENKNNDTVSKLSELYKIMYENSIMELQTNFEGYDIKIKRFFEKKEDRIQQSFAPQVQFDITNKNQEIEQEQQDLYEPVVSPINGVFYRAPSPTSKPFVNEGDVVSAGDVLCIVEAMKVMNEIKANKKCKIVKVLCQNGESISAGTKLFLVEPL